MRVSEGSEVAHVRIEVNLSADPSLHRTPEASLWMTDTVRCAETVRAISRARSIMKPRVRTTSIVPETGDDA